MGHDVDIEHQTSNQCQTTCNATLPCGHVCASLCHEVDPEHKVLYRCPIKCDGLRVCGHECRIKAPKHGCSKHTKCFDKCGFMLECGHLCSLLCHHLVTDHMKCFMCGKKPLGSLDPANGNKVVDDDGSNGSIGFPTVVTASAVEDMMPARLSKGGTSSNYCSHQGKMTDCDLIFKGRSGLLNSEEVLKRIDSNDASWFQRCSAVLPCRETSCFECCLDDIAQKCPNNVTCANPVKRTELISIPAEGLDEVTINPGHKHATDTVCLKKCKSLLPCGHKCTLQCNLHRQFPHVSSHKCQFCTLSDMLLKELSVFRVSYSTPFDYCTHLVKKYNCERVCEGRRCEHPCGLADIHKCSDHAKSNKIECQVKCGMKISCRHKCCKTCHIGDYEHKCRWMIKYNKTWCFKGPYADRVNHAQNNEENASDVEQIILCNQNKVLSSSVPQEGPSVEEAENIVGFNASVIKQTRSNEPNSVLTSADRLGKTTADSDGNNSVLQQTMSDHSSGVLSPGRLDEPTADDDAQHIAGSSSLPQATKSDMYCRHTCNQCSFCSLTDALQETVSSLQVNFPVGVSFNHCSHLVKMYECEQICKGRLCGHPCGLKKPHHVCLDHVALNKVSCREVCEVQLSCGQKCFRTCHVGDKFHNCKAEFGEVSSPQGDAKINSHRTNEGCFDPEPNSCCSYKPRFEEFADPNNKKSPATETEDSTVISADEFGIHCDEFGISEPLQLPEKTTLNATSYEKSSPLTATQSENCVAGNDLTKKFIMEF